MLEEDVLFREAAVLVETKDVMLEEDVLFREERKDVLLVGMKGAVLVGMKDALLVVKGGVSGLLRRVVAVYDDLKVSFVLLF
ncbi:hypothetical protein PF010_g12503 [Phytophthora fragariae]|uniref:Uncharacterized protein n=1 Tax=Phytophthora fragariae TaxID=53985 RepID=A0A6G0L2J9_9STRA|nr:hypothetical protein PF010_g12503 [Phytophthora fragariae]KAE9167904.1 hypothetical protein PF004_g28672 [Phytophthora fragariae]